MMMMMTGAFCYCDPAVDTMMPKVNHDLDIMMLYVRNK